MRDVNLLSIVVPCHNEQEVLPNTHKRLTAIVSGFVLEKKCANYEIVYVDNGSTDDTLKVLKDIFEEDEHIQIVSLRRDFGYQGSISAGMAHAKGDCVVTIDADLQDPPEEIEKMIEYYEKDYDLVLGVRKDRSSDSFFKRFFSEGYYRLLKLMGVDVVHNHGDFRLMARSLVDEFNDLTERNRFIRAMILKLDSHYATVEYKRQPRRSGRSKFGINSLFSLSLDGIVSFSYVPLRLAALCGLLICVGSIVGITWVLYIKMTSNVIPGWASTLLPIFAFGGFQLFVLGLIGEYIGRLYIEVKQRPVFLIRRHYTHNTQTKEMS